MRPAGVAAALEHRVWLETSGGKLYPNLYVMLVAPPAVGKGQAIDRVADIWKATKHIHVAPDSMTKASMLDTLAASSRRLLLPEGAGLFEYASLAIAREEFGVLVSSHDLEFLSFLIALYNNPPSLSEVRRTSTSVDIIHPQLNMLVGSQPSILAHLLPEEAWGMGFMSRMVMIYATFGPKPDFFDTHPQEQALRAALIRDLQAITKPLGAYTITPEFRDSFRLWHRQDFSPAPQHSKLVAASRANGLTLELEDLTNSRGWILQAEAMMPDIFREMTHRSDNELIQELHVYAWQAYSKNKKPVHEQVLFTYLRTKTPSERVPKIIEAMARSGMLDQIPGSMTYIPKAIQQIVME